VSWDPTGRAARIVSLVVVAGLALAIGSALAWKPWYLVGVAVVAVTTTWLTGSIARAFAVLSAATGFVAALLAAGVMVREDLFATLHVGWGAVAIAWLVLVLAIAALWRRGGAAPEYGLTELVGAAVGLLVALLSALKVDVHASLVRLLVHVEDNEAWVGLATQVRTSEFIGPGFVAGFDGRGSVMATIVGLLGEFQGASIPLHNAAFAAWAVAVFLVPVAAVALLRRLGGHGALVAAAVALIVAGWAYFIPLRLFEGFGHLTATWAFLFLLVTAAIVAFDEQSPIVGVVLSGLAFAMGTVWYPIFPLGLALLVLVVWRSLGRDRGWRRTALIALATAIALVVLLQMLQAIGLIGAPPEVTSGLETLYAAQGGTANLDGTLAWMTPLALVGLAFLALTRSGEAGRLWRALCVALAYVGLVFAGAFFVGTGLGYGPTKVWFLLGFAIVIGLVALVPRIAMPGRALAVALLVLAFGSLVYGGSGLVLQRSWPGHGTDPAWLAALQAATGGQDATTARPVACFSGDKYNAYFCTRWAGGMSTGRPEPFLSYRLAVMGDRDPTPEIEALIASGALSAADIVMLDAPPADHPWAWKLLDNAGRVLGPDGNPTDPEPAPPTAP